ncbi:MAG: ATP-binding cassette domain-containing protein, partial [Acidimicrobiales bacterium]
MTMRVDGAIERGDFTLEITDVTMPPGVTAVVGPNGGGKTTLLRVLLGAVEFQGSVRFHWRDGAHIGYVPQQVAFDQSLPLCAGDFLELIQRRWPVPFARRRLPDLPAEEHLGLRPLLTRPL